MKSMSAELWLASQGPKVRQTWRGFETPLHSIPTVIESRMTNTIIDWPNKRCMKCRKPLVYEAQLAHYAGWRLDCTCWDEKPTSSTLGKGSAHE